MVGQVVVNSPPLGAASEVRLAESETRKEGAAAANAAGAAAANAAGAGAAAVDVEPGKVDKNLVLAVLKQAKLRQEHSLENR